MSIQNNPHSPYTFMLMIPSYECHWCSAVVTAWCLFLVANLVSVLRAKHSIIFVFPKSWSCDALHAVILWLTWFVPSAPPSPTSPPASLHQSSAQPIYLLDPTISMHPCCTNCVVLNVSSLTCHMRFAEICMTSQEVTCVPYIYTTEPNKYIL